MSGTAFVYKGGMVDLVIFKFHDVWATFCISDIGKSLKQKCPCCPHIPSLNLASQVKDISEYVCVSNPDIFYVSHCTLQILLPVYLHKTKQFKSLKHQCFANKMLD